MGRRLLHFIIISLQVVVLAVGLAPGIQPAPAVNAAPAIPTGPGTANWLQLAAGGMHVCGLTATRVVKCWGDNRYGQLGNGTLVSHSAPAQVPGLFDVQAIASGYYFSCALLAGGEVKCWGQNHSGQLGSLGLDYSPVPVTVPDLPAGIVAITAGGGAYVIGWAITESGDHACALTESGAVWCWGNNVRGQLGDGQVLPIDAPGRGPTAPVLGLDSGIAAVAAGALHTCALTTGGGVKCWGSNYAGAVGIGAASDPISAPVDVVGLASGVQAIVAGGAEPVPLVVSAGGSYTCALLVGGTVECWGSNASGQLGTGVDVGWYSASPQAVPGLTNVAALAAGGAHACARLDSGAVWCWGSNWKGQLALADPFPDDPNSIYATPQLVGGLDQGVVELTAGSAHTCAVDTLGDLYCWGDDVDGRVGDGGRLYYSVPQQVLGLEGNVQAISVGDFSACALTLDETVLCWPGAESEPFTEIEGLSGVLELHTGSDFACVLLEGGTVKCWGYDWFTQDGTYDLTPVDIPGLSNVSALDLGWGHACALVDDGVWCWGSNAYGSLGIGSNLDPSGLVQPVGLDSGVAALSAGQHHTCALLESGVLKCWGDVMLPYPGDDPLGWYAPNQVQGLSGSVAAVWAGHYQTCVQLTQGGVECWGRSGLGDAYAGTLPLAGLAGEPQAVSGGADFGCALLDTGGLQCWGFHRYGQLGDGSQTGYTYDGNYQYPLGYHLRPVPVDVLGMTAGVTQISTGRHYACALTVAHSVLCWGRDDGSDVGLWGQLGLSDNHIRNTPVRVLGSVMALNYETAEPGSTVTVIGRDFPANSWAVLTANGRTLLPAVRTSPTGNFRAYLDTDGAPPGDFELSATTPLGLVPTLELDALAPARIQEGGGVLLQLAQSIELTDFVFFPLLRHQ